MARVLNQQNNPEPRLKGSHEITGGPLQISRSRIPINIDQSLNNKVREIRERNKSELQRPKSLRNFRKGVMYDHTSTSMVHDRYGLKRYRF